MKVVKLESIFIHHEVRFFSVKIEFFELYLLFVVCREMYTVALPPHSYFV